MAEPVQQFLPEAGVTHKGSSQRRTCSENSIKMVIGAVGTSSFKKARQKREWPSEESKTQPEKRPALDKNSGLRTRDRGGGSRTCGKRETEGKTHRH